MLFNVKNSKLALKGSKFNRQLFFIFLIFIALFSACRKESEEVKPAIELNAQNISNLQTWYKSQVKPIQEKSAGAVIFDPQWGEGKLHQLNDGTKLAVFPVWRELAVQYFEIGFMRRLVVHLSATDEVISGKIMEMISSKEYLREHKEEIPVRFYEGNLYNHQVLARTIDLEDIDENLNKSSGPAPCYDLVVNTSICAAYVVEINCTTGGTIRIIDTYTNICENGGGGESEIISAIPEGNGGGNGSTGDSGGSGGTSPGGATSTPLYSLCGSAGLAGANGGCLSTDTGENLDNPYQVSLGYGWEGIFHPNIESPGYHYSHPVSQAIQGFNTWIWRAFQGSNNISTISFHQSAKNGGSLDTYRKGIGVCGEGIMASTIFPELWIDYPIPSNKMATFDVGIKQDNYHQDMLAQIPIEKTSVVERHKIKIRHTDRNGVSKTTVSEIMGASLIYTAKISFEVKTLDPNNTAQYNYERIKDGIQEAIDRASVNDASVLILDKKTYDNVMASTYATLLTTELNRLDNIKNELGQPKTFLRLVSDLHLNSNSAYHAIFDLVKVIP